MPRSRNTLELVFASVCQLHIRADDELLDGAGDEDLARTRESGDTGPSDTGIRQARAKTDRLDARTLARLLAAGSLDAAWRPDRQTWVMRRRLSRRGQLVWARSRAKNEIHAVLTRQLVGRPPFSDLFGARSILPRSGG